MKILAASIVVLMTVSRFGAVLATNPHQDDEMRAAANQVLKTVTDTITPLGIVAEVLVDREDRNLQTQGNNNVPLVIRSGVGVPVDQFTSKRNIKNKMANILTRMETAYGLEAEYVGQRLTPNDKAIADVFLQSLSNSSENGHLKDRNEGVN